jgi:lipoprotein-anchoring transpeptidase ErfK/SrfK
VLGPACGVAVLLTVAFTRVASGTPPAPPASEPPAPPAGALPPWNDPDDLPIPGWALSVTPHRSDEALFAGPSSTDAHRGSASSQARLPLYGARRGAGCNGRWLLVGPLAWVCSDYAEYSPLPPVFPARRGATDGLPYRYFFVGPAGAYGYTDLARVEDDAPDGELQPGFSVAVVEERDFHDERWTRTRSGYWIRATDLGEAHPSTFHGEPLPVSPASAEASLAAIDVAWVGVDRAMAYGAPRTGKPEATLARFDKVRWREERAGAGGPWVRVSDDGAAERWMRTRDLLHPTVASPPADSALALGPGERWIDVELATQTLVAYEGTRPVFATLVSTGRGPAGSGSATPPGVHRLWVKLLSTNMDNLENDEAEQHYSIEDVPYVQFFDKAVALHGAFWHHDFGRPHSHGCVNLAPRDARWLFGFTSPHLPPGWSAVMPMRYEKGTVIRVR